MTTGNSVKRMDGGGGQCGSSRSEDVAIMYSISRGAGRPSVGLVHGLLGGKSPAAASSRHRRPVQQPTSIAHASTRTASTGRFLPSAWFLPVLGLLLLTLMACRPCHGHDPELLDMDDEDGKFQLLFFPPFSSFFLAFLFLYLFYLLSSSQTATHTFDRFIHIMQQEFLFLASFNRISRSTRRRRLFNNE